MTYSSFINNTANRDGGAIDWAGVDGCLIDSTFADNVATQYGGAVYWGGNNGILTSSTFTNNTVKRGNGGAIFWNTANSSLSGSTFIGNTAVNGGAVYYNTSGSIINCNFNNNWIKSNGVYAGNNLTINGGKGIVDIVTSGTLSGASIVVLNNETYYYPPNTNINFTKKNIKHDMIE